MIKTILLTLVLFLSTPCNQSSIKGRKYFEYDENNEIVQYVVEKTHKEPEPKPKPKPHVTKADTTQHEAFDLSSDSRAKIIMREFEHFIKVAPFVKLYKTESYKDFFIIVFDHISTTHKLDFILFADPNDEFKLIDIHRIVYSNGKYTLYSYKPLQDTLTSFRINYTAYYQFIDTGSSLPYLK